MHIINCVGHAVDASVQMHSEDGQNYSNGCLRLTLLNPRKLGGWSLNARTEPPRLAARYRRTAKPSPSINPSRA